jgi:hypothetical protein
MTRPTLFSFLAIAWLLRGAIAVAADPSPPSPPQLAVYVPSEVVLGDTVTVRAVVVRTWTTDGPQITATASAPADRFVVHCTDPLADFEDRLRISEADRGRGALIIRFGTPGLHRVSFAGEGGLAARSAPIRVLESRPAERLVWGDLDVRPAPIEDGPESASTLEHSLRESVAFARAVGLDFAAFVPDLASGGGLAVGPPHETPWDAMTALLAAESSSGEFVALPGFTWLGGAGDYAIVYPGSGPLRAPPSFVEVTETADERGGFAIACGGEVRPRFAESVGRSAGLLVARSTRSAHDVALTGLRRGLIPAFVGGSSTGGGAPGATSITGVRVESLSPSNLVAAVRARRTWATNGERMVVDFDVDDSGDLPRVLVRGVGTASVERIEIYRNGRLVYETRELPPAEEFDLAWEDPELLALECLDRTVAYHARVVQSSRNAYDPSQQDFAVTSPREISLTARHFDTSHARRGGAAERPAGEVLAALRDAWSALRAAPDRPLRADDPSGWIPSWTLDRLVSLRDATQELSRLAARDAALVTLARDTVPLASIAEALTTVRAASEAIERAAAEQKPTPRIVARLTADARRAHEATAKAQTMGRAADWEALAREWFAARLVVSVSSQLLPRVSEFASLPERARPIASVPSGTRVEQLEFSIDPRILAERETMTLRTRSLARELEERWGYTEAFAPGSGEEPLLRVRIASAFPPEARLTGLADGNAWAIPFERSQGEWIALVPAKWLPSRTDPRLRIVFDAPASVDRVYLEETGGAPIRERGAVERLEFRRTGEAARAVLTVARETVDVSLVGGGGHGPRVYWAGTVSPGQTSLAFPATAFRDYEHFAAQWGFAGWTRAAGTTLPGHDVARATEFGVAGDGRAVLGLLDRLILVDPYSGSTEEVPYPDERVHEAGRPFAALPVEGGLLVRGTKGAEGWVALLDLDAARWTGVAPGPGSGTLATHPDGGYAWLAGRILTRRLADGRDEPPLVLDVTGELLGFDPAGNAVVRLPDGGAGRFNPKSGALIATIEGVPLAVDPGGAVLLLDRIEPASAVVARRARIRRVLADGSAGGSFWLDFRPSPVLDPPLRVVPRAGGSLLVLGGSTFWRRGPSQAWWGASVEVWDSVWTGQILVPNVHF